jgi:hypothetical protein
MNPAILSVLKNAFFRTANSLGTNYLDRFPLVNGKRAVPKSLIALAATGVRHKYLC